MKSFILIVVLFNSIHTAAQSIGKKYTFKEIGWSIVLPDGFTAFPSADQSILIQPGIKADDQSPSKRLMMAMKDANTFAVALASCNMSDEHAGDAFSASNKREYTFESRQEGVHCDSATTTVVIDGVSFKKFRLTIKKNNLIQENRIVLFSCYKGYGIYISLLVFSKKAGEELESMLELSKFSK